MNRPELNREYFTKNEHIRCLEEHLEKLEKYTDYLTSLKQAKNNEVLDLVSCCFIVTDGKTNIQAFNNEKSAIKLMEDYHKLNTPQAKQVHYIKLDILD